MTMTLSGDGTITGLVAGGLPNATVTADDLAAGAALNSVSDGVFFRNRIINGDMRIDQRNAGAAVTVDSGTRQYAVDRFNANGQSTDGVYTAQQDSSAPEGFVNSVKITVTTADASISSGQFYLFRQYIEGTNISDFMWGTANAKTITISFWVRSSLTGTFGGSLRNSAANRSYVFSYSISVADTWEYKTVTIGGDTSGTWLTTNGVGIQLVWSIGDGPDRLDTAGSWYTGNLTGVTGQVQIISTLNATWYITGVQLEVGSVATPFERRPYGTELALCQRYYYSVGAAFYGNVSFHQFSNGSVGSSTNASAIQPFLVAMRTSPTFTATNPTNFRIGSGAGSFSATAVTLDIATPVCANINYTSSGMTTGQACGIFQNAGNLASLNFSAEL